MLPSYHGDLLTAINDVVPVERTDGDEVQIGQIQADSEAAIVVTDFVETCFAKIDEVHFVDRDDHVTNAQQRDDETVTLGLRQHPVTSVNQNHGQIRSAAASGHIARVLLVAGRVRDDEFAFGGAEVAVGNIDRDPLLTFGFQTVGQQRGVKIAAGGADRLRVRFELRQLIFVDHLAVVQQTTDQRALPVIDAAASDEPQQLLVLMLFQVSVDVGGDEFRLMGHGGACEQGAGSGEQGAGSGEQGAGAGAGSGERGAGSRERGAGSGERGAGSGERGAGSGERGAGSRERGAGSGERGAGSGERGAEGSGERGAGAGSSFSLLQAPRSLLLTFVGSFEMHVAFG